MVVLQAVGQRCGLVVDRVKNTEEIVVKPLHKTLAQLSVFSGATIMGNGRVALILDVAGLARIAGVVERGQDTADESAIEVDDTEEIDGDRAGDLLVCLVGHDRHVAVPLSDVARLEEIPVSAIQSSAGQPVTAYRSHIMPLLSLDGVGESPAGEHGRVSVVVHAVGRRYVGLCVDRIVDIAEMTQELDTSQRQPAIRGRTLIDGRVVDIIDIRELARTYGVSLPAASIAGGTR